MYNYLEGPCPLLFLFSLEGLSQDELEGIIGYKAIEKIDNVKLEICIRSGTAIEIHPDEVKYWLSQEAVVVEEFTAIKKHHDDRYKNMLAPIIEKQLNVNPTDDAKESSKEDATVAPCFLIVHCFLC